MISHANKVQNMITAKEAQKLSQQSKNIKDQEKEKTTERLLENIYKDIADAASKGRTSYSRLLKPDSYCRKMLRQVLEEKGFKVLITPMLHSYNRGQNTGGFSDEISIGW